ncbi:MAG: DUF92 domain-containing protein [Eubacteriales bacterium]|nr:DUF92 domain-containing protein [Eubacteriales bacterium]
MLSSFVEATGTKGCDNFSLPLSAGLFACLSFYYGSFGFYLYILFTVGILLLSLKLRLLTADGVVAAIMTATTLYLLGSPWLALSLHGFYLLGSSVSKVKNERKRNANRLQESTGARTWVQVVCNSLPASILVWFSYFFPKYPIFALLAFAVFSAAAADTFSSELGTLSKAQVFDIITGKKVHRGLSGGVSFPGLIAGLVGSLLLSLFALPQFGLTGMIFVAAIGFLGTLIDSVLGALFQRKYLSASGELSDKAFETGQKPTQGFYWISNNTVNFLSLLLVSLIGHLANLLYRVV